MRKTGLGEEYAVDNPEPHKVAEPIAFVGWPRIWCPGAKGEGGRWAEVARYRDANGHSLDALGRYRYRQHLRELGEDERADALDADITRQIIEYEARAG